MISGCTPRENDEQDYQSCSAKSSKSFGTDIVSDLVRSFFLPSQFLDHDGLFVSNVDNLHLQVGVFVLEVPYSHSTVGIGSGKQTARKPLIYSC